MGDPVPFKYRAFLSYSHRDTSWGKWLHRALESYRIDKDLVGRRTPVGAVPKTLRPIFRDRDDFSAGHSLTEQTLAALEASEFLIVLCSTSAAKSTYVNEEVRRFKQLGRADRVIPVIIDGEPNDPEHECFPAALRYKLGPDGALTQEREEPIAADARRHRDGREIATQKIVAGLLGLSLDEIVHRAERARKRRNRFWAALAGCFLLLAVTATASAVYAYQKLGESTQRLDQAIEFAYGFVAEATGMSDRFGVPADVTLSLLKRAESALNDLISRGAMSQALLFRRAQMLVSFSESYFNLGQTADAARRAADARGILLKLLASDPGRSDWKIALLHAQAQSGNLAAAGRQIPDALANFRAGLATGEQILRDDPQNFLVILQVTQLRINLGDLLADRSPKEAAASYESALGGVVRFAKVEGRGDVFSAVTEAVAKQPRLRLISFAATNRLIALKVAQGSLKEALAYNTAIHAYWEQIAVPNPQSIGLQEGLADAKFRLAGSLLDSGLIEDALATFRDGLGIGERLAASDPANVVYKRIMALQKDGIGRALLAGGKADEAVHTFQTNLEAAKRVVADPGNVLWQGLLGVGQEHVGDALTLKGDFAAALTTYQAAAAVIATAVKNSKEDPGWQTQLAISHVKVGEARLGRGMKKEGEADIESTLDFWRDKVSANPDIVVYQTYLREAQLRLAEIRDDSAGLENAWQALAQLCAAGALGSEAALWLSATEKRLTQKDPAFAGRYLAGCDGKAPGDPKRPAQNAARVATPSILTIAYQAKGDVDRGKGKFNEAISEYSAAIAIDPGNAIFYNVRALAYQGKGEFGRSIADLDEAIRLNPNYAIALANRGFAYFRSGRPDEALADLNEALRLDPGNSLSYAHRADVYRDKGEFDRAMGDYDKAIQISAGNAGFYNSRALAYQSKGAFDESIADLDEAIRLNPQFAIAYSNRGFAFAAKGDVERALGDYGEAIRIDPKNAISHANRGNAYRMTGDFEKAIVDYTEAIEIDPHYALAYNARGLAYQGKADWDGSIADFTSAVRYDPEFAAAYSNRGVAYAQKGMIDEAFKDFEETIRLDPKNALAYGYRGELRQTRGQYDEAIADYDKAIGLNAGKARFYNGRALAYIGKGKLKEAIADFDEAIRIDPKSAEAFANRGSARAVANELSEAIADFTEAIRLNPGAALSYDLRGVMYLKMSQLDRALADFDTAIRLDPRNAIAHTNRGRVYEQQGKFDEALAEHAAALQIDPKLAVAFANRGLAYEGKRDRSQALTNFEAALAINPMLQRAIDGRNRALAEH